MRLVPENDFDKEYKLYKIYYAELARLLISVKDDYERFLNDIDEELYKRKEFFKDKGGIENKTFINIGRTSTLNLLANIVLNAANINKMLFNENNKRVLKRCEYLSEIFKDIDISEIKKKHVRNRIEHFDEQLDKFKVEKIRDNYDYIFYNDILCDINDMGDYTNVYLIRGFDLKSKTYHNFGKELNLEKVYQEVCSMFKVMESHNLHKSGSIIYNIEAGIF